MFAMNSAPTRIASLVPSLTETLFALGLGANVVARTGFCIHPAGGVSAIPKVGGTKDVHLARLRELAPTHALVNMDENRRGTAEALREFVPHVIVTHPCAPEDNLALVEQLAGAFAHVGGVQAAADEMIRGLQTELALTNPAEFKPRQVLYLIWRGPWMTVARDTYIARLLARVNWHTVPAVAGGERGAARYPALRGDEPWLADVQRVLLSSEPYGFTEVHRADAQALCPGAAVQFVDGELLSWYGSRAVAGLRYARTLAAAP